MAVAVPSVAPGQDAGVDDIVGGQQAPIAFITEAGSSMHPKLDHDPDSPSPEVFIVTDKFDPGLQAAAVVILKQKFQFAPDIAPVQLSPKLFPALVPGSVVSKYQPNPKVCPVAVLVQLGCHNH